jgi:O-succinylbenzoate synthase
MAVRIERVELRHIRLPLVHPFETSFGRQEERDTIIVKLFSQGLVGYGETASMAGPWYSYETIETCWHVQRDFLIPMMLGREVESAAQLMDLFAPVRGHNMAKTGLEQAFWDLSAKQEGVPLAEALGGTRDEIECGVGIGIQATLSDLLKRIESFLAEGYRRIKIKIKPGWDLSVVREVRRVFPHILLMVDANSAYTLDDTELFVALDEYRLLMIEQPLGYDDIVDHARLQSQIQTPVCLDESIHTPDHARQALDMESCRIINIKPGRVGGLHRAKQIHDLCQERGASVWCGGMLETGIGRAHNVALASLPNFQLPGDISASKRYYEQDLVWPPFEITPEGMMAVPQGPGIGVEVDEERLEKVTVRNLEFPPVPQQW